jgi:hypothetical protein
MSNGCLRLHESFIHVHETWVVSRTTLVAALLAVVLLAGCTAAPGPAAPTDSTADPTTPPANSSPAPAPAPDEPPLDFDGGEETLAPDDPPHVVRLVNEGSETRNVTFTADRDGETVYEQSFRSFPNTTVLGELDRPGNYTLTATYPDEASVTTRIAAESFDCNHSTTRFDLSNSAPTVRTTSTEMVCGTTGT